MKKTMVTTISGLYIMLCLLGFQVEQKIANDPMLEMRHGYIKSIQNKDLYNYLTQNLTVLVDEVSLITAHESEVNGSYYLIEGIKDAEDVSFALVVSPAEIDKEIYTHIDFNSIRAKGISPADFTFCHFQKPTSPVCSPTASSYFPICGVYYNGVCYLL